MSNSQISTFNFKTFPVRTQLVNNEPRFCLADVCAILDIKNPRDTAKKVLDPKGVDTIYILTNGGEQAVLFINEPNLYRIIFKSRKAEAVEFQNWVFEEVLPQIRKTGQYSVQEQLALPEPKPDVVIPYDQAYWIAKYLIRAKAFGKEVETYQRQLFECIGIPRYVGKNDLAGKGYDLANEFNHKIDPFIEQIFPQTLDVKRISNF